MIYNFFAFNSLPPEIKSYEIIQKFFLFMKIVYNTTRKYRAIRIGTKSFLNLY